MITRGSETHRRGYLGWIPLRIRITLWVLAIFAVVHVTLSFVVVLFQRQAVQREIEADLIETTEGVAGERLSDLPGLLMLRVIQHARAAKWGPVATIVFSSDGELITSAGPYTEEDFEELLLDAARDSRQTSSTVFEPDGGKFLYATTTIAGGQHLVVAVPTNQMRRAVDPIAFVLLLTLPIGLVSTGVATWYMAGFAMRPLLRVQSFAEELSAENVTDEVDFDDDSPEIEHLRDELRGAMKRISEGYERQARFLANVSHELKTPISVVRTEAEVLLAGDAKRTDLKSFVYSTAEEMGRLGRMVESFLLLTRIRHGTARINLSRHASNEILMEAIGYCARFASQHEVRLIPTLDESEEEAFIEGNSDLLQTAIGNLVRNAIRFSPKGEAVEVACESDEEDVKFTIRDHGPGVPPELVERIFEPFTQADEERQRGRGTGLGLQIAQGIAELHGGRIEVANMDRGCCFSLIMPKTKPK